MSKLTPQTRALFDAARDTDDPTDADVARVHAKLIGRLGAAAIAGGAGSVVAGTAAASAKPLALGLKLLVAIALVGGTGGALYAVGYGEPAVPAALAGASTEVDRSAAEATAASETRSESKTASPAPSVDMEKTPPPPPIPVQSAPAPAAKTDSLAQETALLDQANVALREGRTDAALRALDQHEARYRDGSLRDERLGARILVLCRLGRVDEARAEAARLLQQSPRSPVAARVRGSCAGR